jgi:hypothetical protein
MALETRRSGAIIVHQDLTEEWTMFDEKPSVSGDGWDSLKVTFYCLSDVVLVVEDVMTTFAVGTRLGTRRFWLTDFEGPICVATGIYKVEATFKGLASDKPVVVSYGSVANQQSAENITIGTTNYPNLSTQESSVTAIVRYVIENYADAPTDEVAFESVPPEAPAVGPSRWIDLEEFTYHSPNGWVLMGVTTEPLPGTTVAFITLTYQYIRPKSP